MAKKLSRGWLDKFDSYGEERPRLTRAHLVKIADFWRAAGVRWQDWAKALLKDPPNGMWGDDMSRELLRLELRAYRRGNGRLPSELLKRHGQIGARNISRRLARAIRDDHVKRRGNDKLWTGRPHTRVRAGEPRL